MADELEVEAAPDVAPAGKWVVWDPVLDRAVSPATNKRTAEAIAASAAHGAEVREA
jgi:hypothetical protein